MNYDQIKENACKISVMDPSPGVRELADLVRALATKAQELEGDVECKIDDPKYTEPLDDVVKRHVESLSVGSYFIDDIARAIGMMQRIVDVAGILRRMEGKVIGDCVISTRLEGRRRLFTISSHNAEHIDRHE